MIKVTFVGAGSIEFTRNVVTDLCGYREFHGELHLSLYDISAARLAFAAAPDTVTVSTDSGGVQLAVPGGPYALTANSDGGPQSSVGIATDPRAPRSITVNSDGKNPESVRCASSNCSSSPG